MLFVAAEGDDFILPTHSETMHAKLGVAPGEKHLELVTDDETSMIRAYNKLKPGERERDELGTFYWWVSR